MQLFAYYKHTSCKIKANSRHKYKIQQRDRQHTDIQFDIYQEQSRQNRRHANNRQQSQREQTSKNTGNRQGADREHAVRKQIPDTADTDITTDDKKSRQHRNSYASVDNQTDSQHRVKG